MSSSADQPVALDYVPPVLGAMRLDILTNKKVES
jgi:hypothetical protein